MIHSYRSTRRGAGSVNTGEVEAQTRRPTGEAQTRVPTDPRWMNDNPYLQWPIKDSILATSRNRESQVQQGREDDSHRTRGHSPAAMAATTKNISRPTQSTRKPNCRCDLQSDRFIAKRTRRKGNKNRPEPPTLIAKVRQDGGELWLGGLPLRENLQDFKEKNFAIQIHCFHGDPERRAIRGNGVDEGAMGMKIPDTMGLQLNMDDPADAQKRWPRVMRTIHKSLHQGDNAYMHCMTGVHQGGLAGSMTRAVLHEETIHQAIEKVKEERHIKPDMVIRAFTLSQVKNMLTVNMDTPMQRPIGWAESSIEIHAIVQDTSGTKKPMCTWETGGWIHGEAMDVCDSLEAIDYRYKVLCDICRQKMPASFLVQAAKVVQLC